MTRGGKPLKYTSKPVSLVIVPSRVAVEPETRIRDRATIAPPLLAIGALWLLGVGIARWRLDPPRPIVPVVSIPEPQPPNTALAPVQERDGGLPHEIHDPPPQCTCRQPTVVATHRQIGGERHPSRGDGRGRPWNSALTRSA